MWAWNVEDFTLKKASIGYLTIEWIPNLPGHCSWGWKYYKKDIGFNLRGDKSLFKVKTTEDLLFTVLSCFANQTRLIRT